MKILQKIKSKLVWILGGIIAVLGILLAIEYEKEKIKKLKNETIMVKSTLGCGLKGTESGMVKGKETILQKEDETLQKWLKDDDKQIEHAKEPKNRSTSDIAGGFNNLYGSNNESGRKTKDPIK